METRFLLRKYYCFYEKVRDKEKKPTVRQNFEGVFQKQGFNKDNIFDIFKRKNKNKENKIRQKIIQIMECLSLHVFDIHV